MSLLESNTPDFTPRRERAAEPEGQVEGADRRNWFSGRRIIRFASWAGVTLVVLAVIAFFGVRYYLQDVARKNLPQLDGSLTVPGLSAAVNVGRDARGVPHIQAATLDDLVFAQGFVTASDRLFQMDMLRRHAAGELAEVLGVSLLAHDRAQRNLQIRAAADRAVTALPADQMHLLETYARGVNASIAAQRAHPAVEFRLLRYTPAVWTPRDSILVSLAMFEDLTNTVATKLAREALLLRVAPAQRAQVEQDLYPVGSWRDHPPASPVPDLTIEGPPIEDIPLDESQSRVELPTGGPGRAAGVAASGPGELRPGSNNWVISGAHTASGKPLLANDMHLGHTLPGIWYEADLEATQAGGSRFHAAGVSIPGLPLIVVGHNDHVAWGFTNLGADVQDIYMELVRGQGTGKAGAGAQTEFRAVDGTWQPMLRLAEVIKIHGLPAETYTIPATRHGDVVTPILDPSLFPSVIANRALALRWTIYDPANLEIPTLAVNSAHDWTSFLEAFSSFGGPAQNVVYADDQGHIGYHAVGRVPLRGPATVAATASTADVPANLAAPVAPRVSGEAPAMVANSSPLAGTEIAAPGAPAAAQLSGPIAPTPFVPTRAHEWDGYIPFDQMPEVFDPPSGVIATANARTTPDGYRYPITLNWAAPYRNERIWNSLAHRSGLKAEDMLNLQSDIYSDFDHVLAQRLAYAIDGALAHPSHPVANGDGKTLRQAADLLRTFNGRMTVDSSAAAILSVVRPALWPALLAPRLASLGGARLNAQEIDELYVWGEKSYALEQVLAHTPPRWLPPGYANWNEFLAHVVLRSLVDAKAPGDLSTLRYGNVHAVEIEHPIFGQSPLLQRVFGLPTGTGVHPQPGDGTTIRQVARTFGPSERFTADLGDLSRSTLNLVLGQSGNPASPWMLDQFPAWLRGSTYPEHAPAVHRLTLTPQ